MYVFENCKGGRRQGERDYAQVFLKPVRKFSGYTMSGSADDLLKFIDSSPTPYHVVQTSAELLKDAGFQYVSNSDIWLISSKIFTIIWLISFLKITCDRSSSGRWKVRLHTASELKTLKWFLLLLCQVRDLNS